MCLAIPGQILEITDPANRLARVDVAGVRRTVNIGLLDERDASAAADQVHRITDAIAPAGVRPGDWVLIHVGFAISKVDEAEAAATLELLQRMGPEYEQELAEIRASSIQ